MDIIFYLNWVSLGVIIVCQTQLVRSAFKAWKHVNDEKFGKCIKAYLVSVSVGTLSGLWLLLSHYFFK